MTSHRMVSLFTGAGGLDLGLEAAGFEPALCVESDSDSRATLRRNRPKWRLSEPGDVYALERGYIIQSTCLRPHDLSLLAAGPPCQPFSKAGYWANGDARRLKDPRAKTLEAYLEIVEETLPQVLLLENVKGLAFRGKDEALTLLQNGIAEINKHRRTRYNLQALHVNAADYGVPQHRERIFLVAEIEGRQLAMPQPTHGVAVTQQPLTTAWDAIGHLDKLDWDQQLKPTGRWADLLSSVPEGRNYLWHTPRNQDSGGEPLFGWRTRYWSFLLKLSKSLPAWTIQAEPGPATGPFHWRSRLLSIEELCRLQTFPRDFLVCGDRRSAHRQIGNAVPSVIGELFGLEIRRQFFGEKVRASLKLATKKRDDCPLAEPTKPVPKKYFELRRRYRDHPGPGLGPGARRHGESKISGRS